MNQDLFSDEAWQAFNQGDYELAGELWQELLKRTESPALRHRYQYNYARVLTAQERFAQARSLLHGLFEQSRRSKCLHQLGRIAQREGQIQAAQHYFELERRHLSADDHLALAANAYELSMTLMLKHDLTEALRFARLSAAEAGKAQDPTSEAWACRQLGDLYWSMNDLPQAGCQYALAHQAFSRTNDHQGLEDVALRLASLGETPEKTWPGVG